MLTYADPGWRPDGRARYPIDTLDHAEASLAALDEAEGRYPPNRLQVIRSRISRALRRFDPNRAGVGQVVRSAPNLFDRSYALDNIEIVSRAKGGDGRTVEAYAAMFNKPYEVHDQHGDYHEVIAPSAFDQTIKRGAVRNAVCLYNHGMNLQGQPDPMAQIPIGTPLDIRADSRGLLTVTRYDMSEYSDRILAAIDNGSIRAQSFRGRIIRSSPNQMPGRSRSGALPTVTRHELGLSDYGPTPIPVNADAEIVAVRSRQEIINDFAALRDDDRLEILRTLGLDVFLDEGDDEEDEDTEASEDDLENEDDVEGDDDTSTSTPEAGSEEPPTRALRSVDISRRIRAEMIRRGMA